MNESDEDDRSYVMVSGVQDSDEDDLETGGSQQKLKKRLPVGVQPRTTWGCCTHRHCSFVASGMSSQVGTVYQIIHTSTIFTILLCTK